MLSTINNQVVVPYQDGYVFLVDFDIDYYGTGYVGGYVEVNADGYCYECGDRPSALDPQNDGPHCWGHNDCGGINIPVSVCKRYDAAATEAIGDDNA